MGGEQDTTGDTYCAIKDYAKTADSAKIVHCIHAVLVAFDINVWFEYVPSKEHISDRPSRGDNELITNRGFRFGVAKLPTVSELFSVSNSWTAAQEMRRPPRKSRPRSICKKRCRAESGPPS